MPPNLVKHNLSISKLILIVGQWQNISYTIQYTYYKPGHNLVTIKNWESIANAFRCQGKNPEGFPD